MNRVKCLSKVRIGGKTVIITGGNSGIGKHTALELAERGGKVFIAARNVQEGTAAVAETKQIGNQSIFFYTLNLASKASIQGFAQEMLETVSHIDIFILNAGVMFTPYQLTEDGFDFSLV